MGGDVESRFERYAEVMVEALGHADRATPARWYLEVAPLFRTEIAARISGSLHGLSRRRERQ
jgi:hypothetical protein